MDEARALRIVDLIRRFADELFVELGGMKRQLTAAEVKAWQRRIGNALGPLQTHLLNPIEDIYPDVIPASMGGRGPDRPLKPPRRKSKRPKATRKRSTK